MAVLPRHAVIVVHGIGEKAPFQTVRSFVGRRTAVGDSADASSGIAGPTDAVFSEPSPVATRTDDRAYTVTWDHSAEVTELTDRGEGRAPQERVAITDFFEFYWAPRYRFTRPGQVVTWLIALLRRRRSDLSSERLVGRSGLIRAVPPVLLTLALAVALVTEWAAPDGGWEWVAMLGACGLLLVAAMSVGSQLGLVGLARVSLLAGIVGVAVCVILFGFTSVRSTVGTISGSGLVLAVLALVVARIVRTLGDAARYLSTQPDSVEENDLIRKQLLGLLERLHTARDLDTDRFRYDRITVVGHSLGSVIAYDGIRLLWTQKYRLLVLPEAVGATAPDDPRADAVLSLERAGLELDGFARRAVRHPAKSQAEKEAHKLELDRLRTSYESAQERVQLLLRDSQSPSSRPDDGVLIDRWIITDFITLGSPLAYADAFMATSMKDLADRFEERSLASSPPDRQRVRRAAGSHPYRLWIPRTAEGPPTTRWHQAAPFACVRWQNLWFEHDLVGGPVAGHFGPAVRDISLGGRGGLGAFIAAYPHSSYWRQSTRSRTRPGSKDSIERLRRAIKRRPTLLLTTRSPRTPDELRAIGELLGPPPAVGEGVDVRLYVGEDRERVGGYLPIGRTRVPRRETRARLRDLLGQRARVALLSSPNVLAAPDEDQPFIDPGVDLIHGEAPEADVSEAALPGGAVEPDDLELEGDGREIEDTTIEEE